MKAKILALIERYGDILRFGCVGVANTAVDFVVFTLLTFAGVNEGLAQGVAYSCGVVNSFLLNKFWTFRSRKTNAAAELLKFLPVNAVSMGVTVVGIGWLTKSLGLNVFVAKLIITVFAQFINYFGYKLWVFRKK